MRILAIASKGTEYMYRTNTAHKVPTASAEKIRSALNNSRYHLRENETWHLYDVGPYSDGHFYGERQRFFIRSGRLFETSL